MAAGDTLVAFQAEHNQPPDSNYATIDLRNGHVVIDFDDSSLEAALFSGVVPRHYSEGALAVALIWAATSANSGAVRWTAAFERHQEDTEDLDSDNFATPLEITSPAPATPGALSYSEIGFTAAEADSIAAGEHFRIRITRDSDDASDTMTGDAELLAIEIREA